MKTFTIDTDNSITVFATQEEAAATTTPFDSFASQKALAQLAGAWPAERLAAIWNSLPGVKPVKGFQSAKAGASRIWERILGLGEPEKPPAERKAKAGAPPPKSAPPRPRPPRRPTPPRTRPRPKRLPNRRTAPGRA